MNIEEALIKAGGYGKFKNFSHQFRKVPDIYDICIYSNFYKW